MNGFFIIKKSRHHIMMSANKIMNLFVHSYFSICFEYNLWTLSSEHNSSKLLPMQKYFDARLINFNALAYSSAESNPALIIS